MGYLVPANIDQHGRLLIRRLWVRVPRGPQIQLTMGCPPFRSGRTAKLDSRWAQGRRSASARRTQFRDFDGVTRQLAKFGPRTASAERALKLALRDRSAPGQSEINAETGAAVLGKRWLDDLPADRSTNTRQTYAYVL